MTITIKDVAARAGVSPKTVSRVINGEQHVREPVRIAVMRVVEELGYRPNAFARSLSSARSYLIGLFFHDPASGYATAMQRGALTRCRERNYHLLVEAIDLAAADWRTELADLAHGLRLDGAIIAPPLSQSAPLLDRLQELALPFVCVSPDPAMPARSAVVEFDERHAAFDMTRHLLALGHRRIGFVAGDPAHASTALRHAGFAAAMTNAGLAIAPDLVLPGDFSFRAGFAAGEMLLTAPEPPSAIFASNDDMALGVSVAAMKRHVPVPDALSVAGFDDAPTARLAWPAITTVRQPMAAMGAAAVDLLVDRAASSTEHPRQRLEYEIVQRESTGPAR